MLRYENSEVRQKLLWGGFGLEKESLRIDENGLFVHTDHPFTGDEHIVRDFCENQAEINTGVSDSAEGAVKELAYYTEVIQKKLSTLPQREYLWQFSNPPYIRSELDIPIARYQGDEQSKTFYRNYLSDKYGRYKMTFSGIHMNFSFSDELLQASFALSEEKEYTEYKNRVYLDLAEKMIIYGWLLVAVTAASPVLDSSYVEKGKFGQDIFTGMASVRCSELGYWNEFAPILNYSDIRSYADSIQAYVDNGLLRAPSELYYPIRLKPPGKNSLEALREKGVNHIELRMFDLNPLRPEGVDVRDVKFAQLLMVWLASKPRLKISDMAQVQAVQNYKNAARYDLKTVKIFMPDESINSVVDTAQDILGQMKKFYNQIGIDADDIISFENLKFEDAENRYAWQIRKSYSSSYVEKALILAKERQKQYNV